VSTIILDLARYASGFSYLVPDNVEQETPEEEEEAIKTIEEWLKGW
jgi:hypothetical protein